LDEEVCLNGRTEGCPLAKFYDVQCEYLRAADADYILSIPQLQ